MVNHWLFFFNRAQYTTTRFNSVLSCEDLLISSGTISLLSGESVLFLLSKPLRGDDSVTILNYR